MARVSKMSGFFRYLFTYIAFASLEEQVVHSVRTVSLVNHDGSKFDNNQVILAMPQKMKLVLLPHDLQLPQGAVTVDLPENPINLHLDHLRPPSEETYQGLSSSDLSRIQSLGALPLTAMATTVFLAVVAVMKRRKQGKLLFRFKKGSFSPCPKMQPCYDSLISPPDGYRYNTFPAKSDSWTDSWSGSPLEKFEV